MRCYFLSTPALRAAVMISVGGLLSDALGSRASGALTRQDPGAGQDRQGSATLAQPVKPGLAGVFPTWFQATVYEVQGPADRLGSLSSKELSSQASTAETLLSALAQTGKARLLYRFDQPVDVYSTRITIGASEPLVTGARTTIGGQTVNSISYQNVGAIVRLSAQANPAAGQNEAPIVSTAVKLSVLTPGEQEIVPGTKAVAIRAVSLELSKALEMNQPQVRVTVSSNAFSSFRGSTAGTRAGETPAAPVAYVMRYEFGPPAPASAGATEAPKQAGRGLPPGMLETARSTNRLPIQFQASVYKVEPAGNRLPRLDVGGLERARTPELFLRSLNEAGKPRVLYQFDQAVNVLSDQIMTGTNMPVVTAVTSGPDGKAINSYTSHNMGVSVRLSAQAPPKEAERETLDVNVGINLSDDAPGGAELGLGQKCLSFPLVSQQHTEPLELGRWRVLLAMGTASANAEVKPFIYVVRYQFSPLIKPGQ
jgi:hypothetical protein